MLRRSFIQNSLFTLGSLSVKNKSFFKMFAGDSWKITMLTDDIGIFTERGGTIAFHFSKEGITVIDAEFPDTAAHLIDELKKRNDKPFRLLINTHHHRDHTAGNIAFKDLTSRVLAHENSLKNQKNVAIANKIEDQQYYPNNTFGSVWEEKAGKERISLHYFGAGHTDGDAIIHLQHANIVHMGDLVFNRRHPFVDRSAGASMKSWINVLDTAMNHFSSKTKFIFGHAGDGFDVTGTKDDLLAFHDYLSNVLKFVDNEMKAGKTKDEILKATEIPGSPEWKGDGIQRPLQAAFEELSSAS
ncbi:MAG TPA: MBL fold metallo-hydrolase [Chitinophagaceae bacterium]|nr:MBL fold metallo-hydrolase [Chitinophagaceae bacterium]